MRTALLIVVSAALGGIGYLVSRNVVAHRAHPLEELGRDFLPQVAQRIQNFRRVKVEHGRMMWEITAPGDVTIHGRTLDVRGHGMEIQVGPQHVRLLADVHTRVHGNARPS